CPSLIRRRSRQGEVACPAMHLRELAASLQRPRTLDELVEAERMMRRLAELVTQVRRLELPLCGARLRGPRAGLECAMRVHRKPGGELSTRCRMHGGASTGPRSAAGSARQLAVWWRWWTARAAPRAASGGESRSHARAA